MSKVIDFKQGLEFHTTPKKSVFFKEIKKILKVLGVKTFDNCCNVPVAINVTATATTDQILNGYITSTSAAAVSITLPTAAALATALGAKEGSSYEFTIDNSAGANTVTVIVGTGITVNTPAITGGATLTVSVANAVGIFKLVYITDTTAKILRVA